MCGVALCMRCVCVLNVLYICCVVWWCCYEVPHTHTHTLLTHTKTHVHIRKHTHLIHTYTHSHTPTLPHSTKDAKPFGPQDAPELQNEYFVPLIHAQEAMERVKLVCKDWYVEMLTCTYIIYLNGLF